MKKRSLMFLRSFYLFLTVLVSAVFACQAYAAPTYRVIPLGKGIAKALNNSGDVVGYTTEKGICQVFVYTAERGKVLLSEPAGNTYSIAYGVSDRDASGKIYFVGLARMNGVSRATRWRYDAQTGTVEETTDMGVLLGDATSVAYGVNQVGEAVGTSDPGSFTSVHAFFYSDGGGMAKIPLTGAAYARAINENGVVTGYANGIPYRYSLSNGVESLGTPENYPLAWAYAINDKGQVAASPTSATGNSQKIARYSDGTGWQILGGLGETNLAYGINNLGDVVGKGKTGGSLVGAGENAVIYTDELGTLMYVNDLLESGSDWLIKDAYDINDAGEIVANAWSNLLVQFNAVLLIPVGAMQVPTAPLDLTSEQSLATSQLPYNGIKVSWEDISDSETGFKIERRGAMDADFSLIATTGQNAVSYLDTKVETCQTYEYRVYAFNIAGDSGYSNTASSGSICESVDTEPPVVTFSAPQNGSKIVAGTTVTVSAQATDNTGITLFRLYKDNRLVAEGTSESLSWNWRTWKKGRGSRTLRAWATDATGNTAQQVITVELVQQ